MGRPFDAVAPRYAGGRQNSARVKNPWPETKNPSLSTSKTIVEPEATAGL